jgi:hypothetical protein
MSILYSEYNSVWRIVCKVVSFFGGPGISTYDIKKASLTQWDIATEGTPTDM